MKIRKSFAAILIVLLPLSHFIVGNGLLAQRFDVKFTFDGADREFIVVKPTGAVPAGGYPVVFMFHGSSGDGEQFYNISKWKERGEIEKFITVFPTALKYCVLNFPNNNPVVITKWNNGNLIEEKCPNVTQVFKDDVKFIRKMVDTIKATFNVNPKKVFAAGFSNGGAMVAKLAMDASDIFAAVAQNGSMMNSLDSTKPTRTIPIWSMVGTLDDRFTSQMGIPEIPFGGDSVLSYMRGGINRYLVCESLSQTYTKSNTARTNTFLFTQPLAGNTNRYIFTLVKGLAHEYPNGINDPIIAADLQWEFFKQSVATDVKEVQLSENEVKIYPNPSGDRMTIDWLVNVIAKNEATEGVALEAKVYNTLGQQVYAARSEGHSSFILEKNKIGTGFFILKVNQGEKFVTKRIVFE
ncbi:MAG: T9SS type A sorting domain-containing protein [Saprospiraceae bacterium]|nr:T9SS type A sorting domain-containing protein [Saprospiraceae bacterium]